MARSVHRSSAASHSQSRFPLACWRTPESVSARAAPAKAAPRSRAVADELLSSARGGQSFGQIPQRDRIAILDPHVGGIKELKRNIGDADSLQGAAKRLRTEVQEPLVALAGVDVDRAQAS